MEKRAPNSPGQFEFREASQTSTSMDAELCESPIDTPIPSSFFEFHHHEGFNHHPLRVSESNSDDLLPNLMHDRGDLCMRNSVSSEEAQHVKQYFSSHHMIQNYENEYEGI